MRKVIANTTPLIALANTGYLHLLRELYGEILIPLYIAAKLPHVRGNLAAFAR